MNLKNLIIEASKENNTGKLSAQEFVNWLITKNRIGDLILLIKNDNIKDVELKKPYNGKSSIKRLENSDELVQITTFIGTLGHMKEAKEVFDAQLTLTPDDTSALNNYGFILINEMIKAYGVNKKYDQRAIQIAQSKVSKAATIDKFLHEEPLVMPAYKNLCLLRAVEATYFTQLSAYLSAFLIAWMSIEMSIYRIFYLHLKENKYSKRKIEDLQRWNIDTIIEVLYLNKCDPEFSKQKDNIDALRKLRNHLIHGDIFEVTEGEAKRCIDVALAFTQIKENPDSSLLTY
jgi:hypothetical protein